MSLSLDDILAKLSALPDETRAEVMKLANDATAGMLWIPNIGPQTDAYFSPADELYYGGSAGGGKTQLMIGLALNEHRVSRLFRRQFKDIDGEGGMAPAVAEIIGLAEGSGIASYRGYNSQKHVWRIPTSLTGGVSRAIEFGAFETDKDASDYQGRAADLFGFDEAVQFRRELIRFITGWNRTTIEGQRCRIVLGSNPPVTPEGLWIFEDYAPWLDPAHPNPAKPGELRWFATVDGHEIEVDAGFRATIYDAAGNELVVRPKSRTFIPASLSDNPDLLDSGYANQLANLPPHLRAALLEGKFTTTLEDADRQVIPTEWVIKAQQRWPSRKHLIPNLRMTALGADVAQGGKDRMVAVPLYEGEATVFGEPHTKPGVEVGTPSKGAAFLLSIARNDPQFNIDDGGGYGGGIAEILESNEMNVKRCKGANASVAKDRDGVRGFANKRAEWIWRFREALDPERGDNIALPPGREVLMELTTFREKAHPEMRQTIQIESNDDIVKRIGRSPDIAWGFFFAWAEPSQVQREKRASHIAGRRKRSASPRVNSHYANVRR